MQYELILNNTQTYLFEKFNKIINKLIFNMIHPCLAKRLTGYILNSIIVFIFKTSTMSMLSFGIKKNVE